MLFAFERYELLFLYLVFLLRFEFLLFYLFDFYDFVAICVWVCVFFLSLKAI